MTLMTLTALYDARAEADRAAEQLVRDIGVARGDVTIMAQETTAAGNGTSTVGASESTGFFGSLKNLFMPEEDRHAYSEAVSRGGFLLTAQVEQDNAERATAVLEEHGAVDLDDRQETWRAGGWTGQRAPVGPQTASDGTVAATSASTTSTARTPPAASPGIGAAASHAVGTGEQETIALVEERLTVGKRAVVGGRVRVRSHVVETPVEEQVSLRGESISIERRAADRPITGADAAAFRGRTIEATETDQEAVVSKTAHVTEELVVRKGVEERVETVRDTVRRTEVEVEDDRATVRGAADGKAGARGAVGAAKTAMPQKPVEPATHR
ncbi:MAG: YsnF/AvaK domain-containing protein [Acetobacteraceae bacterium]|nr:YsnF/AvaK domain-containing protein [Acetobacteraceae bacterium]